MATYLVGRVAWPLYGALRRPSTVDEPEELARASRDLVTGLVLTYIAVAVLALGTASAWWPI